MAAGAHFFPTNARHMRTITLRRVVVTGLGTVTDVGNYVPDFWKSLIEGRSGIGPITSFTPTPEWSVTFAGQVRDLQPEKRLDPKAIQRMDRYSVYGLGGRGRQRDRLLKG
jgi:3-oxoacyl-[acyl-carrier-protein] synthase II